ncbi:hypothetical protein PsorP6_008526 [Peronosclerospora sorghi]|uniref:Uncharacterized protein n=1 Tax=Peronosclerospora sorghi TaxID=230839 RepID=A0ACC0W9S6_9STRA|nr:hypothetical protein PsorP6_008526 [Peronosclerospora sorghi]
MHAYAQTALIISVNLSTFIGFLLLSRLALLIVSSLYAYFLRPAKSLHNFGKWGVVTGATDGIGKALAMELARKGMNVILMSRTQSRLDYARNEILAKILKQYTFIHIDEPKVRESLQKMLDQVNEADVLFNNVGVSYDYPDFFDQLPQDRMDSLIKLNVTGLLL